MLGDGGHGSMVRDDGCHEKIQFVSEARGQSAEPGAPRRSGNRSLVLWSWVVLVLLAAHDATHVLDDGLKTPPEQLALVAIPQWLVLAVVMAIVVRGDRGRRRTAALLLGISVALGFAVVHLLPFAPTAFWDLRPSAVSWALGWVPAAAGLLLFVLAWRDRVRRAVPASATRRHHGWRRARHGRRADRARSIPSRTRPRSTGS